jgi:hypothetical protein
MIWMILTGYAAISVSFSLGVVAGAWWVARARIDDASFELEAIERNDDDLGVVRAPPTAAFYCLGQRV